MEPSTRPSTSLCEKQIFIPVLDTVWKQFSITHEEKYQDQWMLIQLMQNTQIKNQQRKSWVMNLKDILDKSK